MCCYLLVYQSQIVLWSDKDNNDNWKNLKKPFLLFKMPKQIYHRLLAILFRVYHIMDYKLWRKVYSQQNIYNSLTIGSLFDHFSIFTEEKIQTNKFFHQDDQCGKCIWNTDLIRMKNIMPPSVHTYIRIVRFY